MLRIRISVFMTFFVACSAKLVSLNTAKPIFEVDVRYVSMTFDIGGFPVHRITPTEFWTSEYNRGLASAIAPAYFRVGGTDADKTAYDFNGTGPVPIDTGDPGPHVIDPADFDRLVNFTQAAGFSLIFDANLGTYRVGGLGGPRWDPTAFKQLLHYAKSKGYMLAGWELGNEPGLMKPLIGRILSASEIAADFRSFRSVLSAGGQGHAKIIGPDVDGNLMYSKTSNRFGPFLDEFLNASAGEQVDGPDVASWHFYYRLLNHSKASITWRDFVNPSILDGFLAEAQEAQQQSHAWLMAKPGRERWVGETSSFNGASGCGELCSSFVAGFLWLDKLGIAANTNHKTVCRQTYAQLNYSLVAADGTPNPDYYSTVLWKRLVGEKVLQVADGLNVNRTLRAYAFCSALGASSKGTKGSVTLVVLNLEPKEVDLEVELMGQVGDQPREIYVLTSATPTSRIMLLNGEDIFSVDSKTGAINMTAIVPKHLAANAPAVAWPAYSYGFIVLPNANVAACGSDPVVV